MAPNWKMHRRTAAAMAFLLCVSLGAMAGALSRGIRVAGAGAVLPVMKELFDAHHLAGGRGTASYSNAAGPGALAALRDGVIDVAITAAEPSRAFVDSEGFRAVEFMRSPLVFVTAPSTAATSVSRTEVEASYAGSGQWSDGSIVRAILRPRADIDTIMVRRLSPAISTAVDRAFALEGFHWAATDQDALAAAERIPGSLVPSTLILVRTAGYGVKVLAFENIVPTPRAIQSGAYPLSKSFWVTIRQPAQPEIEKFVAFLASDRAREIICESGGITWPSPCN